MQNKGFSIIELLLGIVIAISIAAGSVVLLRSYYDDFNQQQNQLDQQAKAANGLERMTRLIRETNSIEEAADQSLIIYAYFYPTDPAPDRLRFYVSSNRLMLGLIQPQGTAPNFTYPSDQEASQIVAINLANGGNPVFFYYDLNGSNLTSPYNPASIKMVGLDLWIDNGSGLPTATQLTTSINLRNLKNNL